MLAYGLAGAVAEAPEVSFLEARGQRGHPCKQMLSCLFQDVRCYPHLTRARQIFCLPLALLQIFCLETFCKKLLAAGMTNMRLAPGQILMKQV